jgi:adenosylcobyric acid synthase
MAAKVLMIQGTSSSVGKSLLTAALCRIFARQGWRVAPFKAQIMSNNAAVCADGAEIGRAQAVQAAAAGIEPTASMNPILLKPEGDCRSQVIVRGRHWQTMRGGSFYRRKDELWPVVTAALDELRAAFDVVVIEGAGSPVELNLRHTDIVNMALARYAAAPVLLAGDIDRGGIFAQMLGTLWLLEPNDRALVRGLIVNKFRGERSLFDDGVRMLQQRSELPVLGVVPYLSTLDIPEEDAVALDSIKTIAAAIDIAVIRLPHIANFDDFDPLRAEAGVRLRYVQTAQALGQPHAVILPGTKSTLADLAWLRRQGLDTAIQDLAKQGTAVVGICGGYQMLGQCIYDPDGVESSSTMAAGLGLLPLSTTFGKEKAVFQVRARVHHGQGWAAAIGDNELEAYEIHMGRSTEATGWMRIVQRNGLASDVLDGSISADGRLWGCYLHGLFANSPLRQAWLKSLSGKYSGVAQAPPQGTLHLELDRLADAVGAALDMDQVYAILHSSSHTPCAVTLATNQDLP